MTPIQRFIQPALESALFHGRPIVLYGARQTGKTTLLKTVLEGYSDTALYLDCSDSSVQQMMKERSKTGLASLVGSHTLVALDDAHLVRNIGLVLKQFGEDFKNVQVIAAGSVTLFDLSNDLNLPLTGGKTRFYLYPLAVGECSLPQNTPDMHAWLGKRLCYGMYPQVIEAHEPDAALARILESCLEPAALLPPTLQNLPHARNLVLLRSLLEVLALRIGSEVSYNELGETLGLDKITVGRYIALAEQAGILFHLPPFKRQLPRELGRLRKIYFYDLGLRNALLRHFNPLHLRSDVEALWENFFVAERFKYNRNRGKYGSGYFWRVYNGTSLDYLEEEGGHLTLFDCSWLAKKRHVPGSIVKAYPGSELHQITPLTFQGFLGSTS